MSATASRPPAADTVVDGRYRLEALLGEGTFGGVWKARDTRLAGRPVAVKFLKAEFLEHAGAVARFEAEADALAQVSHPNIVGVIDRGSWSHQRYIVMEFVEGRSLSAWIAEHTAQGQQPDVVSVLALFDQLCAGLEAAHAVRNPGAIVHRDLKPDNVIVRVLGGGEVRVKVLDFGIAQLGRRKSTQTGALMGTPLYMAPEQAMGQVSMIGPWTDVFSLGVLLVEALSGRPQATPDEPWWGTALQRQSETRRLLERMRKDIPAPIVDVIVRCLRALGSERPADAGVMRAELRQAGARAFGASVASQPQWSAQRTPSGVSAERTPTPAFGHEPARTFSAPGVERQRTVDESHAATDASFPWARVTLGVAVVAMLAAACIVGLLVRHDSRPAGASTTTATPRAPAPARSLAPRSVTPQALASHEALARFIDSWVRLRQHPVGAEPVDHFYAASLKYHGSTRPADFAQMALDFQRTAAAGGTFSVSRTRSDWSEEAPDGEGVPAACRAVSGATGSVLKVRVWAEEVRADRNSDIGCPRLEGRYLLRLRETSASLRICHETWSVDEGICASCPTAPLCLRRR